MKRFDKFEHDMLAAYEGGALKSISPTKADLAAFKAAASATLIKERRVNIRLTSRATGRSTKRRAAKLGS